MSPVALPPGVEVPIELPPFCYYFPGDLSAPLPIDTEAAMDEIGRRRPIRQKFIDQADALIAAVNTPHFPVLRRYHFDKINQRLATWPL